MTTDDAEYRQVRAVSLQNANAIFLARQRSERDLLAAKEALRKSEEQLRAITDATPALIAYLDTDCRYRFANLQYSLWFGHPQEEVIGLHMRGARRGSLCGPASARRARSVGRGRGV